MILEQKSNYKSWSYLKKQMNGFLCDSLKNRISYFYTTYHEVHNAYGRASINLDNKKIVSFSWTNSYTKTEDIKEQYKIIGNVPSALENFDESKKIYHMTVDFLEKNKWMVNCNLCETDFLFSITAFLKTDITTSLNSDNYLLRIFAFIDRRVGKRTLVKIKNEIESLPNWVKQFYFIRCEAENIKP